MMLKRSLKDAAKRMLFVVHRQLLRTGVILLPNHYYVDCPDVNSLAGSVDVWAKASALVGVTCDIENGLAQLRETCDPFISEVRGNPHYRAAADGDMGPGFGYIEAQVLHCFLRSIQPRKVVEIGSGVLTYCMLRAIELNERSCEIISVEPFPRPWLRQAKVRLIERQVQSLPLDLFESLGESDFLFIDSSHAVKTGSDVVFLILEVLPRLKPGVLVHFHDIYLPYDYAFDTLHTFIHPQETALLHAFLIGNRNVEIMFSLSRLHHERPTDVAKIIPEYKAMSMQRGLCERNAVGHFPSSIYLRFV